MRMNRHNSIDTIMRYFKVERKYLKFINLNYLSLESLKNAVSILLSCNNTGELKDNNSTKLMSIVSSNKQLNDNTAELNTHDLNEMLKILTNETGNDIKECDDLKEDENIKFIMNTLESDELLLLKDFREERINIYLPLITYVSEYISKVFINNYSFSRLETNSKDKDVLELLVSCINSYKNNFWIFLIHSAHKTSNLYIVQFIENNLINILNKINIDKEESHEKIDKTNIKDDEDKLIKNVIEVREYLKYVKADELTLLR